MPIRRVLLPTKYTKLQNTPDNGRRGLSAATVIKIDNILSGALKQAVINRLIGRNPLDETKAPKIEDNQIRILTNEEQRLFIGALPFFNTRHMFSVALATGMRIGEICALDKSDINRDQKYIDINKTAGRRKDKYTGEVSIKVGPPKTRYSIRRIPLLPSVEVMLDRQEQLIDEMKAKVGTRWKDNSLVFPTDEGNIHDLSGIRSSLHRILKRAGLPHMTVHALQHTYATTALNSGVAAQNVARLLGHKDGATTLRFYAYYINTEAMIQLEKLEEQNNNHLGISADELQRIVFKSADVLEKTNISKTN
ncbi:MAG: site-specific integrase [Methanomethylovorans sp.]|jgi:integrase|nr:site-specific integrase [Methanomethylovorans sp.]